MAVKDIDNEEKLIINKLTRRILKNNSGNYTPFKRPINQEYIYNDIGSLFTNRGNKLLQKSELITRDKLNSIKSQDEECIYYNGSEHNLLQRDKKFKLVNYNMTDKNNNYDESLNELINIEKILTPISNINDICNNDKIFKKTFNNNILNELNLKFNLNIEREKNSVNKYSNLLEIFLGDHPSQLLEKNLLLPKYDHKLEVKNEEEEEEEENDTNTTITEQLDVNNNTHSIKTENDGIDPFFKLPQYNSNKFIDNLKDTNTNDDNNNNNIEIEIETGRQLAQIALQRNTEYIKNLQKSRSYIIRAQRIKERLYHWSCESAGKSTDKDIMVPEVLKDVKRGLISATTNNTTTATATNNDDQETRSSEDLLEDEAE